jgi:sugar phosphate isomerase/epimerase
MHHEPSMQNTTRRTFLRALGGTALGLAGLPATRSVAAGADDRPLTLGFSLYGMKTLKTEDAIKAVARIGYDSVEFCLMPDWDATPARLGSARRKQVRALLHETGLKLPALMEHVALTGAAKDQQGVHERLKQAAGLGHDLSPTSPPLVETTMGGGQWEKLRGQLRDNLGGWARVAEASQTVVAVKAHRFGVVSRPEHAVWLVEQVGSPWIRLVYDYSHFIHRDIPLAGSIRAMAPYTRFVHVKDTVMRDGNARFLLPGESGQTDYVELLKLLVAAGYRGDVCCEVSGMVSHNAGYDPVAAARTCYRNMAKAFQEAAIRPASARPTS